MIVKTKTGTYEAINAGHWLGLAPIELTEIEAPVNRWTGPKKTIDQWQQVLSFFHWSYQETRGEAMVHWFMNESQERWEVMVLPQQGYTGMTTKLLDDHANYIPTFQRLGAGWEMLGTDHHHCSASAFQSGTDLSDEKGKEGLHTTVGNIGAARYDLHARSSFRNTIMPVRLTDWFEMPEAYQGLPEGLQEQVLRHLLTTPSPETAFPDWWKDNVVRYQPPARTQGFSYQKDERVYTPSTLWERGDDGHWGPKKDTISKRYTIEDDLAEFMEQFSMEPAAMEAWVEKLGENEHLVELSKIMGNHYSDIQDVLIAIYRMSWKDAPDEQTTLGFRND